MESNLHETSILRAYPRRTLTSSLRDAVACNRAHCPCLEVLWSLLFVCAMQGTVLMALLQPAPEVYELFDDILLMAEGHIIYHGPKEEVLPFFESLGFKLPPRKGIGDFLQEVSNSVEGNIIFTVFSRVS